MNRICLYAIALAATTALTQSARAVEKWETLTPQISRESVQSGPGEVSVEKCITLCRQFLKKIGAANASRLPTAERTTIGQKRMDTIWICFPQEYSFRIFPKNGQIESYQNDKLSRERVMERHNKEPSAFNRPIKTRAQALERIRKLEKALGIGSQYVCTRVSGTVMYPMSRDIKKYRPPTLQIEDFSEVDSIEARYEPKPFGYRIENLGGGYSITIDNQSKAITRFQYTKGYPYVIESHGAKLSQQKALSIIQPIIEAKKLRLASDMPAYRSSMKPELMFVQPNEYFGGPKVARPNFEKGGVSKLRLAWAFRFTTDSYIYVDASDGRILGGFDHEAFHSRDRALLKKATDKNTGPSARH